jgi:CubicO group peptidase (beta-lactamase class C family)
MTVLILPLAAILGCTADNDTGTSTGDTGTVDAPPDPRYDAFIAALEEDFALNSAYGTSVAITQGRDDLFTWTVGTRDADGSESLSADTLFQIGSTTKMFTATAALIQVQAGHLALDDSLADVLPDLTFAFDADWQDEITLHQLLSMQSGFVDIVDWTGSSNDDAMEAWHMDEFPSNFWQMVPAGSFFNYSNPGVTYAGYLTQVVDPPGRAWPDIMLAEVFQPLGMNRTFVRALEAQAYGDWAESYGYTDLVTGALGTVTMSNLTDPASQRPAGSSTWSTPTQLLQMAHFLMEGDDQILDAEHRALITTAHVDTEFEAAYANSGYGRSYGYGMSMNTGFVDPDDNWVEAQVWCHGGATISFASSLCILPDYDFAISILSSGYGSSHDQALAAAFSTLIEGLPEGVPNETVSVDPDRLDDLVGTYDDPWNLGEMIITRVDDTLVIEMPLLDQYNVSYTPNLEPYYSDLWFLELQGYWYDLSFIGPDGEPATHIRNRSFVGIRTDSADTGAGVAGPPALPPGLKSLPRGPALNP